MNKFLNSQNVFTFASLTIFKYMCDGDDRSN